MFKAFVALSAFVLSVYCATPEWPNIEEAKAEMIAAGLSSEATDGILKIASDFASQKPADGNVDREAARAAFLKFLSEVEDYVKTQSPADQAAYESFIAKKKAQFDSDHNTAAQ
uniref:Secreted protein n=1 Tax=Caenorhabditis tropicalis TaxID=1561998 RepID=A0A1I7UWI5_9PELO